MIENETQYQITKAKINKFEEALIQLEQDTTSALAVENPIIWEATKDSIKSVLAELVDQVVEYEISNKEKE